MKPLKRTLAMLLALIVSSLRSNAQAVSDEEALLQVYGDEELITIATGKKQPVSKAPAVTTVITADDIKAIGATDLDEVLETVPGLHVARGAIGYTPIYTIRGIFSEFNPQVLVLINDIPITNLFLGNRNNIWGGMSVEAIQRIEIIRGPGSAVYGADAFAGVINIITKAALDIDGTELGGRRGSFDTWDGWLLHGGTYKGFEVAAMLEYHDTDGQRENIDADAQTLFDNILGTNASLAPGTVNLQRENIDARLDIHRANWRLRAGLQRRRDWGTGAGGAQALDPDGRFNSDRWNVDLTYHNPSLAEQWDVEGQISYFDTSQEVDSNEALFPRGTVLPIGPDGNISGTGIPALFPNGFIGNPEVFERHARFNVSAFYTGFFRHLLRMGTGFNYANIWKVKESKNFGIDPSTQTRIEPPGSRLVETTDTPFVFLNEGDRENFYFFLQDSWRFANDWELTGGLRYDYFSDFGGTVNPRFALAWQTRQNLTSKLLYGEAFRAPSFAETSNINNPVALGNPDLEPEKIRTAELAFDYLPTEDFRLSANVYRYWWSDIIRFVPDPGATSVTAQNTGEQTGYGLEIEADWHVTPYFSLLGNYAFQISEDDTSNEDAGNAPHHQVYVRADWEFLPNWRFNPQVNWIVDRDRVAGDNRPEIDDYSAVDVTLRRIGIDNHWDVVFAVRNLFDSDVREPSLAGIPAASIPDDLPQAGRSFYGEVRFRF
ncbi:MAG: TonB-dependent receptor plug domain-containing protein [Gammaproteobacteria bacterium]